MGYRGDMSKGVSRGLLFEGIAGVANLKRLRGLHV